MKLGEVFPKCCQGRIHLKAKTIPKVTFIVQQEIMVSDISV